MQSLLKKARITIRFTPAQLRRVRDAATAESKRRGILIEESALLRELGLAAVDRLLAEQDGERRQQAERRKPAA